MTFISIMKSKRPTSLAEPGEPCPYQDRLEDFCAVCQDVTYSNKNVCVHAHRHTPCAEGAAQLCHYEELEKYLKCILHFYPMGLGQFCNMLGYIGGLFLSFSQLSLQTSLMPKVAC